VKTAAILSSDFSQRVRAGFASRAGHYDGQAKLQQAVAWRLARWCRDLPLPAGPVADLGCGSGLLSRALMGHWTALAGQSPLQLDYCPSLLALNPLLASAFPGPQRLWDLNNGLPVELDQAALLASSFALHWLDDPVGQLEGWCDRLAPGGWLVLAVPTAGSFPQWRQAAAAAAVPCTALDLPEAAALLAGISDRGLRPQRQALLRFSQAGPEGLASLHQLKAMGAGTSRQAPLSPGQWRRLRIHWPSPGGLSWEVLLVLARREPCA
jgi:malonyl-CoA O-methyltransferase